MARHLHFLKSHLRRSSEELVVSLALAIFISLAEDEKLKWSHFSPSDEDVCSLESTVWPYCSFLEEIDFSVIDRISQCGQSGEQHLVARPSFGCSQPNFIDVTRLLTAEYVITPLGCEQPNEGPESI
ncbi:hypothetical protein LguiA_005325 [Lonicera macranthoides]